MTQKISFALALAAISLATASSSSGEAQAQTPPPVDAAPAAAPAAAGGAFVFLAPADTSPLHDELGCGVRFGFRRGTTSTFRRGADTGEVESSGPTAAVITTFSGSEDLAYGKGVRTQAERTIERSAEHCRLSLTLGAAEPYKKGVLNWGKPPEFTAADVLLQTPVFVYRPEFDSPFPAASLMANFDRLTVKECFGVGYNAKVGMPRGLRGQLQLYCAKTESGYAPFVVECLPYRTGSKCTATTILAPTRTERSFDARAGGAQFRAAIEAVLSN